MKLRTHIDDLRGASRLAIEATNGVCDLVEAVQEVVASGPATLGRPLQRPTRLFNGLVFESLRRITRLVGSSIDLPLAQLTLLLGPNESAARTPQEEAVLAVLNGVLGDYLEETGNPLAIQMRLRHAGTSPGRKLLIMVHGSCMNDLQWRRQRHDHGSALAHEFGYTAVYLHYNSGLHISTNGRRFAELLEQLVTAWPTPIDEIALVAHSMGGLVSRSACHTAEKQDYLWRKKLRAMIFLGTPHHGAPLERAGNWVDRILGISSYSSPFARLGKIRSAGVTDLRHGSVLDEHWHGRDRFAHGADTRTPLPLPSNISCYAIAGTKGRKGTSKLPSDGIVPVESALGKHKRSEMTLDFPLAHQKIGYGVGHLGLLSNPDVYATIRDWLAT